MKSLFVPLDVNFTDDPKVLRAGPDAELVYLRSLLRAAELGDGGYIPHAELMPGARLFSGLRVAAEYVMEAIQRNELIFEVEEWWFVVPPPSAVRWSDPHLFWERLGSTERVPLSRATRYAVMTRDGRKCGICRDTITHGEAIDIDHILPVSCGGGNELTNLQVAHARCNRRKGARV